MFKRSLSVAVSLFLILFCSCLRAEDIFLKDSLLEAKAGNYVVILQNKNFSLLRIFQVQNNALIIEEISAPIKLKSKIGGDWQKWLNSKAPGHISWVLYELNFDNRQIEDIYSCTQKSWKKVFPQEQIFPTLVDLKFSSIAKQRRKRVGPPVPSGLIDDRPLWQPPIFYEGKKVEGILCQAYSAYWPNDGTDLSGKKIDIFLAKGQEKIHRYFPIWMQVSDKIAHTKLRVIDSGDYLESPYKKFPIPPPEITACHFTKEGHLQFQIRSHPAFENYLVYFKEINSPTCTLIPYKMQTSRSSRQLKITVENEDLNNKLELDKLYTFIFEPTNYAHLSVETPKPLKLLKQYATK